MSKKTHHRAFMPVLLGAGVALTALTSPSGAAESSSSESLTTALVEPGKTNSFNRDTDWKFSQLSKEHHLSAGEGGSVSIEDSAGRRLLTMSPRPIRDTQGNLYKVTWTINGNTIHQHIDAPTENITGVSTAMPTPRGFWNWSKCVGKKSLHSAELGGITGCIAGAETGCAPGAGVGAFGGGLAGAVQGAHQC
ncbi:hypothetical protein ACFUIY_31705 [Streptomyces griseorubiginosus]|uniref:hypothetical protein n=1 Tax=Streptomyces griseorubiginosus TaxID=67304 RepID=UPI00363FDAEE